MKEFANNWQEIADTDSEHFAECAYEEFMMLTNAWLINSSHCGILRNENKVTNKVTEYSYRRPHAMAKRIAMLATDPDNVITLCVDDAIYELKARDLPSFFDADDTDSL
jgi:hypothetical protein